LAISVEHNFNVKAKWLAVKELVDSLLF